MGKQAREDNREAAKLAQMAPMATDLHEAAMAKFMVGGVEAREVTIRSQYGPMPGVGINFHMRDGSRVGPVIFDAVSVMATIAALVNPMIPKPMMTQPEETSDVGEDEVKVDPTTASGLIIPGGATK